MSIEDLSADVLLYFALKEELDLAMAMLGSGFKPKEIPDIALTGFFGSIRSPVLARDFRVAVFPAGKMGNTRSANVTSAVIEKVKPTDIVALGSLARLPMK